MKYLCISERSISHLVLIIVLFLTYFLVSRDDSTIDIYYRTYY